MLTYNGAASLYRSAITLMASWASATWGPARDSRRALPLPQPRPCFPASHTLLCDTRLTRAQPAGLCPRAGTIVLWPSAHGVPMMGLRFFTLLTPPAQVPLEWRLSNGRWLRCTSLVMCRQTPLAIRGQTQKVSPLPSFYNYLIFLLHFIWLNKNEWK